MTTNMLSALETLRQYISSFVSHMKIILLVKPLCSVQLSEVYGDNGHCSLPFVNHRYSSQ